jgi:DNA-binding MarR family transcriptional regulator
MDQSAPVKEDVRLETSGYILERTAKKLKQAFQRKLKAINAGVTADQWVVLDTLRKTDGLSQFEIAEATQKDAPTLTRIIDLLCEKKLTERRPDPGDRRRFNVFLTPQGQEKIRLLSPLVKTFRQKSWNGLSNEDLKLLTRILERINGNIDESRVT